MASALNAALSTGAGPTLPVTLPVAPLFFGGTARLSGWAGNAAKVARDANPTTPQTFGFVSDRIDLASIETYVGGQNVRARIDTLFDQSGNGFDFIQTTAGSRGDLRRSQLVGAALPFVTDANSTYPLPAGLSVDRANVTVMLAFKPHLSRASFDWIKLGTSFSYGTRSPSSETTPGGGPALRDTANSVTKVAARAPRTSGPTVMGFSSGPSDVKFYNNGNIDTVSSAFASAILTGGTFAPNGYGEYFALVIFSRALTSAEMLAAGRALTAIVAYPTGQTKAVYMIGDSITAGQGCVGVYTAGLGMTATEPDQIYGLLGSPADTVVFNCGQPSIPLTGFNGANGRARIQELMAADTEITKRVARVHAGINDLRAAPSDPTGDTIYNAMVAYCGWLRGLGVKVLTSTINIQKLDGTYTSTAETARQSINTRIRANWATFADDMVDYDAISELSDPTNTTYFASDGLHQTALAYQLKATLAAPKIAALLAA